MTVFHASARGLIVGRMRHFFYNLLELVGEGTVINEAKYPFMDICEIYNGVWEKKITMLIINLTQYVFCKLKAYYIFLPDPRGAGLQEAF